MTSRPWVLSMRWHDLLFAHWRVPVDVLSKAIPAPLEVDRFDGEAWLGVVPFRMSAVRPRGIPALPGMSAFPELNLRTYVRYGDHPGVYFFSLDAAHRVAVETARHTFGLPYLNARMSCERDGEWIDYRHERTDLRAPEAGFAARYRGIGPERHSAKGSLEHFLTERYCFFTVDRRRRVYRSDVVHEPWTLRDAEWDMSTCDMARLAGVELRGEPLLLTGGDLAVRGAWPQRVG